MSPKEPKPSVRITNQFRDRETMAYDFDCAGSAVTVRVLQSETAPRTDQEWHLEARTSGAPEAAVVSASGTTRAAAFQELARSWGATCSSLGLPTVDWDAIGRAMTAVRAL